jgi:hypothetical protein
MTPEKMIYAFLQIWENNPDDIFTKSGSINGLQELRDNLVNSQNESNSEILKVLQTWCKQYSLIGQKVAILAARKLDASANIPPTPDINNPAPSNEQIRINQYPEISEILRSRLPKATEQNQP